MSAPNLGLETELRVASLNIWNVQGPDSRKNIALPTFLKRCRPDVLLLQEVSLAPSRAPQSSALGAEIGLEVERYFFAGTWNGREEGLAVLSRFPAIREYRHQLPDGNDGMGRIVCGLTLQCPFGPLDVFTTHLAYPIGATAERQIQAKACIAFLNSVNPALSQRPLILGGDFNDEPSSLALNEFRTSGMMDAMGEVPSHERITFARDNPYTTPELHPGRCIDYILHNRLLRVSEATIEGQSSDIHAIASDHYAVVARMRPR